MKLFIAVSLLALQNVAGGNIKQDVRMEQAAEVNTANVFNTSVQGLPMESMESDTKEDFEDAKFKWGSKLHHSSSSEDMSMSMSMSISMTSAPTMTPTVPPDYSLAKGEYGRCHQLPTTDKEKCALYQVGFSVSEWVAKKYNYLGPPQETQAVMKTSSGKVAKGKLLGKILDGLDGGNEKKEKEDIGKKGIVIHPGLPGTDDFAYGGARSELCDQACGILEICPDNCANLSEIEAFCDFAIPEPYKEAEKRKTLDSQWSSDKIKFSPECGFCVDTCRSDCIAFVAGCCPCANAKTIVEASKDDWVEGPQIVPATVIDGFEPWAYLVPDNLFFPHSFVNTLVTNAKDNLGVFAVNSKDGFGILFDDQIEHTKAVKASRLDIVYQASSLVERGFFTPYDRDPLAWLYNENKTLSEDHVHFKGNENDWGILSGDNAQARIVFRDSTGWHITKEYYALDQFKSIRMAHPDMKYHSFKPFLTDPVNVEAGLTLGPSAPSFNCISAIGIQIVATAKKHFCIRRREEEVIAVKEDVQDEVVVAQDEEVDVAFINCKGEYYARWTNLAAEAKTWTGYD